MKPQTKALLYSLFFHALMVLFIVYGLFIYEKDEPHVCPQTCHVIQLATVVKHSKPLSPKAAKKTPPVERKLVKKEAPKSQQKPKKVEKKPRLVVEDLPEPNEVPPEELVVGEAPKKTPEVVAPEPVVEGVSETAPATLMEPVADSQEINATLMPTHSYEEDYVETNLAQIQTLLSQNLYYPKIARKRGIEGEVMVSFCVLTNGEVQNIKVLKTSRDILGRAAIKTIKNLSGHFPKPKTELTLHVPIRYSLQ